VGDVRLGDVPVKSGSVVEDSNFLELAAGASLTLKHSSSGREFALSGPARVRACGSGREQLLLARGRLDVAGSLGSRPGAEVLIATPALAVTYADADFSLSLDDKRLRIQVRAGQVEVHAAKPTQKLKPVLRARDELVVALPQTDFSSFAKPCEIAAEAAKAAAERVADASSREPLGQRAQAHARARRRARIACAISASATGLVADPSKSVGLWAEVEHWEASWASTPPRARSAQGAEK
jgi:hypothetical protein